MKNKICIGLFGLGTVGTGVLKLFSANYNLIRQRIGSDIYIKKAVVRNPEKHLNCGLKPENITIDPDDILLDPEIDVIVELIGGDTDAKEITLKALKIGKSVVTANKALLAEHAAEIFPAAYASAGLFGYEASVAGGIPVIRNLRDGFTGDDISEVSGIINGTANYILTSMADHGEDFDTALKKAQELGFAEADPTFDIEGIDAAHKVAILLNLSFNGLFEFKDIYVEGITKIEPLDIEIAKEMGYTIKLIGKALCSDQGYQGRVHPALIKNNNLLASVKGAFNAILIKGNFLGPTISYGAGAGAYPTASAVVGDLVEIARNINSEQKNRRYPLSTTNETLEHKKLISIDEIVSEYYLRFTVKDQVGVLADITRILGENNISIRSMIQRSDNGNSNDLVPVVIITHSAVEKNIRKSLSEIDLLPFILQSTRIIRIDSVT